jgi:hypothetical protein
MRATRCIRALAALAFVAASLAAAPAAFAHTHIHVGEYELSIGWAVEPTYVGVPNGVEITIEDHDGEPVTDLGAGDITVVVSTADQSTSALPLEPAFVVDVFGTPGQYVADILPTVPGDYTFKFAGSLRGETVDVTVASGEETFSPVQSSSEIEFPVKVPTLADVATRLDRIDGRIEALQAAVPAAGAIDALNATAEGALEAANRAATIGVLVGGLGLVVAVVALFMAWRLGRKGVGTE